MYNLLLDVLCEARQGEQAAKVMQTALQAGVYNNPKGREEAGRMVYASQGGVMGSEAGHAGATQTTPIGPVDQSHHSSSFRGHDSRDSDLDGTSDSAMSTSNSEFSDSLDPSR
jgi:pentatricopeptide repeat protein